MPSGIFQKVLPCPGTQITGGEDRGSSWVSEAQFLPRAGSGQCTRFWSAHHDCTESCPYTVKGGLSPDDHKVPLALCMA